MDDGTQNVDELTLEPVSVVRSRRPRALWGVLAAVALATGALVVTSASDDGRPRPGLPVAFGSSGSARTASEGAADAMLAWIKYVAGEDLPLLGGEAPAYRLSADVSEADVRALADALGLDGDLTHADGAWTISGEDGSLSVDESGASQWWYSSENIFSGGGVSVRGVTGTSREASCPEPGDEPVTNCVVSPDTTYPPAECGPGVECGETTPGEGCAPQPDGSEDCVTPECPANAECDPPTVTTIVCETDSRCECPVQSDGTALPCPIDPPAPVDLPSKDEARAIALDLLAATGLDVDGAKVTVEGPYEAWYVNVEPVLDGVPSGLYASATVGSKGEVTSASGYLTDPESLGTYPVLDTRATIDRANEQSDIGIGVARGGVGFDDVGVAVEQTDPCATPEECRDIEAATGCKVQADGSEICEVIDPGTGTDCVFPESGAFDPATGREWCVFCAVAGVAATTTTTPCESSECSSATTTTTTAAESTTTTLLCEYPVCPPVPLDGEPQLGAPESIECPAPDPPPEPEPFEMVLVDAERTLVLLGAIDGSADAYLVPGYRFTAADGGIVDLPAVADSALTTPPTTDSSAVDPGDPPPDDTVVPAPCGDVQIEKDSSGTTHTVQTDPGCTDPDPRSLGDGEQPELGVGYYVDVDVMDGHCTWISVEVAGQWWWAQFESGTLAGWSTPTEGGTFTLLEDGQASFVGDAQGTKVATLVPRADRPLCE